MFDNIFKKKYQKLYASICKVVYELSLQKLCILSSQDHFFCSSCLTKLQCYVATSVQVPTACIES